MKKIKLNSTHVTTLLLLVILFISSCKKDSLQQNPNDKLTKSQTEDLLSMEKLILQYGFNIETVYLNNQEIKEEYNKWMETLSDDNQRLLVDIFKDAMEQEPSGNLSASTRTAKETLTQEVIGDGFGQSVLIEGNSIYVGARNSERVFEYEKNGESYSLVGVIKPEGETVDFGYSIAVSGDWMAVGAPDFQSHRFDKVFMYKRDGKDWDYVTTLEGPVGNTAFGEAIELQEGRLAVVSRQPIAFPSMSTISVYNLDGNNWSLETELEKFAYSFFSIDMDGDNIVGIGGVFNSLFNVNVNVFTKENGTWIDKQAITVAGFPNGALGRDITIHEDKMMVSAILPGNQVWELIYSPSAEEWQVRGTISYPSGAPFSNQWVDLEEDRLGIASASANNFFPDKAHLFKASGESWELAETLIPDDGGADVITWGFDINGGTIAIGGIGLDVAGKTYVFEQ